MWEKVNVKCARQQLSPSINQRFYIRSKRPVPNRLFSNSALKQLNVGHLLNHLLKLSEFAQPPAELAAYGTDYHREGEGICLFCPWHLLLLTYAGSCFTPILFLKWITGRITTARLKDRCKSATVTYAFYFLRKTLRHSGVYFVMAATVSSTLNLKGKYFLAVM